MSGSADLDLAPADTDALTLPGSARGSAVSTDGLLHDEVLAIIGGGPTSGAPL